jgi:hypothetical protein
MDQTKKPKMRRLILSALAVGSMIVLSACVTTHFKSASGSSPRHPIPAHLVDILPNINQVPPNYVELGHIEPHIHQWPFGIPRQVSINEQIIYLRRAAAKRGAVKAVLYTIESDPLPWSEKVEPRQRVGVIIFAPKGD